MANRFVESNELKQIDLGDGDFVKVPAALSFEFLSGFDLDDTMKGGAKALAFMKGIIKEWNLKLADGSVAEITEENIKKLEFSTIRTIMEAVTPMLSVAKKA